MWYLPELIRIKGELLVQQATDRSIDAAENCFTQAMQLACEQGALLWQLRIALSLARSRLKQGRPSDTKNLWHPSTTGSKRVSQRRTCEPREPCSTLSRSVFREAQCQLNQPTERQ